MPVLVDSHPSRSSGDGCVHIGLINNMSDEALKSTERQFLSLLRAASEGIQVRLSFYTLPGVPRSDASRRHTQPLYSNIEDLWESQVDGLIVTGREPLAANLREEPYWESFTRTIAWAQENVHATVWSCLAAHAAVLHLDGIERVKREEKLFGIFRCTRSMAHPLTAATVADPELPHSRWNGLPEDRLVEAGYQVLTRTSGTATAGTEIDTFIKQQKNLFVFFQGHPEYEADTLLREYRRDVGRYFKGEMRRFPSMPQGYFNQETTAELAALQLAAAGGDAESLPAISAVLSNQCIENTWQSSATGIYKNWLRYIREQKSLMARSKSTSGILDRPVVCSVSHTFDVPAEA